MAADLDARTRNTIIEYMNEGMIPAEIARTLKLSGTTVRRIIALYDETGSIEPRPRTYGPKPIITDEQLDEAVKILEESPSMPIRELNEKLGLNVCETTTRNALKRLGLTFKKKR